MNEATLMGLGCDCRNTALGQLGFVPTSEQWAILKHFYIDQWFISPKPVFVYKRIRGKELGDSPQRVIDGGTKFKILELSVGPNFYGFVSGGGWVPIEVNVWTKIDPNNPSISETAQQFLTNVSKAALATGENIAKVAENISKTAKGTTGTISWLLPTVLILGVAGIAMYGYKHYVQGGRQLKIGPATI